MVKFELTMESGQKLQIIAEEYDLHLAGIELDAGAEPTEKDIYTWLMYAKTFIGKDLLHRRVLGIASKVESIRKIGPKEWG